MNRVITVKGTGKVTSKPDTIILTMTLDSRHAEYSKCMKLAEKQLESLRYALKKLEFPEDALKTTSFKIDAVYKQQKDNFGNYHDIFDVWSCFHAVKLEFSLDCERLSKVLAAIGKSSAQPKFRVRFGIADQNAIRKEVLKDAADNARRKAEILCAASGVTLGEIVNIDYNWGELSLYSQSDFEDEYAHIRVCCESAACINIEPEAITNQDTVTFVWSIA